MTLEQLTDQLVRRNQGNKLIEGLDVPHFMVDEEMVPWIRVEKDNYMLTDGALDNLLKIIKFPMKYYERLLKVGEFQLAEININYWSKQMGLSFLVEDSHISQIFDSYKLHIPSINIHNLIIDQIGARGLLDSKQFTWGYTANYLSNNTGLAVVFNEIFASPPRFDALLYSDNFGIYWRIPTPNRKFQVAGHDETMIYDQCREFIKLSLEEATQCFSNFIDNKVDYKNLIENIALHVRLKRSITDELLNIDQEVSCYSEAMQALQSKLGGYEPILRRNIEIALTMFALAS